MTRFARHAAYLSLVALACAATAACSRTTSNPVENSATTADQRSHSTNHSAGGGRTDVNEQDASGEQGVAHADGPAPSPREDATSTNDGPRFEVTSLTDEERAAIGKMDDFQLNGLLSMYVVDAGPDAPSMLGRVSFDGTALRFRPRYPVAFGVRYRLIFHRKRIPGREDAANVAQDYAIGDAPSTTPTSLTEVYPSANELPENLLKFYLHFSAPMSRGEAYERIRLLDADGNEVADPFLELGEELWDADLRRFTLLFDPGRIKRGLKPREEVGPVLEEGKRYTLVIDADWLDTSGNPLAEEVRKSFTALPPDESPLDAESWRVEPPSADTDAPLVVRFDEPLDHALLERVVRVVDAEENPLDGTINITDAETCWQFTPTDAWEPGMYRLVVDTTLEDVAGNSIGRAFDVDVFEPIQKRITTDTIAIPFTVDP